MVSTLSVSARVGKRGVANYLWAAVVARKNDDVVFRHDDDFCLTS